jgi:PAS domain S-box-containing protein
VGLIGTARDITQRKESERQLADEECLLRALVDAIPDPIFLKDREGRHLALNGANLDLFGIPRTQSLGKTILEWPIPPELAAQYMADDQWVLETGTPLVNREEPYETAEGRKGWLLTSKYPLRNASGEISGLVGVSRDVTALKSATEELQRTRSRMVDHVENSPLAVIEWGPDFRVEGWTGQAHHLFGWKAEEVVGKGFLDLHIVHPEDMPRVELFTRRLTECRERSNVCRSRNLTRSGEVIHCTWYNSALYDTEGRILSILSLVMDVSDQVKADQTILENERLYHALIETTNTGYVLADADGRVLDANEEFVQLTGHKTLPEILHRNLMQWVAPAETAKSLKAFKCLLKEGALVNFEADWVSADGTVIPVEANARVRDTSAGLRIVAFCRNISARRKAEVERQAFERKLLETQKLESLGVLAGGIAHDFNNLLTGVLGNASMARMDAGPDSVLQPCLEQIEEAACRAADLCRQMLAYSGKGSFVVGRMDLNSLVEETSKLLQISVSKKAAVEYDLAPGLPPVLVDATQMRQVIMNLVINASEAVGERGGLIWVRSRMVRLHPSALADPALGSELAPGDYLCLEVRDNGSGMTPEVKARIFDPFFTTKFTGRGLGLAAVQGIVRGHRGALRVESQIGEGTCFRVFLPCADGVADPKRSVPVSNPNWRGSGRVLVVDDEPAVQVTTAHMLESLGFGVLAAASGQAALADFLAAPDQFQMVMLDLTMPSGDGDEVLREIRRVSPRIPVLLMSGFDESEVLARFGSKDIAGFIHKPFAFPVLREKLQEILASS